MSDLRLGQGDSSHHPIPNTSGNRFRVTIGLYQIRHARVKPLDRQGIGKEQDAAIPELVFEVESLEGDGGYAEIAMDALQSPHSIGNIAEKSLDVNLAESRGGVIW